MIWIEFKSICKEGIYSNITLANKNEGIRKVFRFVATHPYTGPEEIEYISQKLINTLEGNIMAEAMARSGGSIVDEARIHELTTRAIEAIYPTTEEFVDALRSGKPLTAYMGIDPTAPDMHVGHESQLLKLRRLQQLGHRVILLIGDFTAMIGDPTDKSAARTRLTREEVLANAEGYREQASKILDFDDPDNPVELRYNSEWLASMGFADVLELASDFTVQQMLERDMFEKRIKAGRPVSMVEFMYPMMQGWDSVAMDVDIEVGGSDQIFNMLAGSKLIRRHKGKQKFVIAGKMLADPSGRKIGKTEGNMITLNDSPLGMYHKIMLWGDEIVPHALELCTDMPMDEIERIARDIADGKLSGLDGKKMLAKKIVTDLHGADASDSAEQEYIALTAKSKEVDTSTLITAQVTPGRSIVDVLCDSGLASSKAAANRLLDGNAVRVNGSTIDRSWKVEQSDDPLVLQVGKKKHENHRLLIVKN